MEQENLKNEIEEMLIEEELYLCCIYLLDAFGLSFKEKLDMLGLPIVPRDEFIGDNPPENFLFSNEYQALYNYKFEFLEKRFKNLKDNLKSMSIINSAFMSETLSDHCLDENRRIMTKDKNITKLNLEKLKNIDSNIICDFIDLLLLFIEYGVISFGINDKTKENIEINNENTFSLIFTFGRYNRIIYTNRDEDRDNFDKMILWIEVIDILDLIKTFAPKKTLKFAELLKKAHNTSINEEFIGTNIVRDLIKKYDVDKVLNNYFFGEEK